MLRASGWPSASAGEAAASGMRQARPARESFARATGAQRLRMDSRILPPRGPRHLNGRREAVRKTPSPAKFIPEEAGGQACERLSPGAGEAKADRTRPNDRVSH